MRRALLTVLVLTAACSSSPDSPAPSSSPAPSRAVGVAPPMQLVSYADCPQLLDALRKSAEKRVGPYGFGFNDGAMRQASLDSVSGSAKAAAPDYSGTNIHEAGVDEPDIVKTDGKRIVTVSGGVLRVVDAASRTVTKTLDLPTDFTGPQDLLLNGDRVLVLLRSSDGYPGMTGGRLRILQVDLNGPRVLGELKADGDLVDARQVGSVARIVVRTRPGIQFPERRWGRDYKKSAKEFTEANRKIVRDAPLEAYQPEFKVTVNGTPTSYRVPCERISRPKDSDEINMLSVLTVDLAKELGDVDPVSVVADGDTVYGTASSLYITGTPWQLFPQPWESRTKVRPKPATTQLHKFAVSGTGRPTYVASGEVPGRLLNQYSLSEHEGNFRVATTSDDRKRASTVYVLTPDGPTLKEVGKLGKLGPGESIYSVRFVGPRAYVVTFRQVDPLYVLDMSDPKQPKKLGELKITGFSSYLHPTADGRILGVGKEANARGRTEGAQISLFDVTGSPKRLSQLHLPKVYGIRAEHDQHAFLYWPDTGLTVLPTEEGDAIVLTVSPEKVTQVGTVDHPSGRMARALVIGNDLWTLSDRGLKASDPATLKEHTWIGFF